MVSKESLMVFSNKWEIENTHIYTVMPVMGKIWQRNYYEHIIRNEESYRKISDYIVNNPLNWRNDKFFS